MTAPLSKQYQSGFSDAKTIILAMMEKEIAALDPVKESFYARKEALTKQVNMVRQLSIPKFVR